ncbi:hypothetical protein N9L23_05930 [Alphaproteobacteria bacterium]|nr:hypothetical protein [Alphaproteobacteria bacterium]
MNILQKIKRYYLEYGITKTAKTITITALYFVGFRTSLSRYKSNVGLEIKQKTKGKVYSGEYLGMELSDNKSWNKSDLASLLLGCYELHIQKTLVKLCGGNKVFIDIGAADGFHAIGLARRGAVTKSICFEISRYGQKIIAENAVRNNVAQMVEINGIATEDKVIEVLKALPKNDTAVMLIDIEGGEYELVNNKLLGALRNHHLVIELHEFYSDQRRKSKLLIENLSKHFEIEILGPEALNPNDYSILDNMDDDKKWMALSEGRPSKMRWIVATPK